MEPSKHSRKRNSRFKWSTAPTSSSKPWIFLFMSSLFLSQSLLASGYVLQEEANGLSDLNSVNSTRFRRDADGHEDPSHLNSVNSTRFRRDAAQFTSAIDNLQHLARISNAISLQTGLSTDNIPLDDFLTEILHMGNMKLDEIFGLEEAKINGFIINLENLSKNLPSKEVTGIENRLISLDNIKKDAASFNDFSSFPGKEEFLADLGNLTQLATLKDGVTKLKGFVNKLISGLGTLKTMDPNVDDKNIKDVATELDWIYKRMGEVEKTAKSLDLEKLEMVRSIGEKSTFIDLFMAEYEFRGQLKNPDYSKVDDVWKNFKNVFATAKQSAEVHDNFETIKRLISNRRDRHSQTFQYTAGFPDGSSDLKQLRRSIGEDFIQNHISNGEVITETLKKAFEAFENLGQDLKTVEDAWENPSKSKSIEEVTKAFSLLSVVSSVPQSTELAKKLKACQDSVDKYPQTDIKPVKDLQILVDNLKAELKKISEFKYIPEFTDLKEHKEEFSIEGKPQEEQIKLAQKVLDQYGPQKDMTAFETKVKTLHDDLAAVETIIDNLPALTSQIDLQNVEEYHSGVNLRVNYLNMYKCLAGISEDTTSVKTMIDTMRNLRQASVSAETKKDFKSIINSQKFLQTVQATAGKLKKVETIEATTMMDSFKNIEGSDSISFNLGMGVQGLAAIEKVFELKSKFDPFLGKTNEITKHANSFTKEQNENLAKLSDVSRVFSEIDDFLKESPQGFRKKREANFESVSKIFDDAASKIKGVDINMNHLVEGLQALHKLDATTFNEPSADLKNLDLDFSKFNFADAKTSLPKLDNFFLDYVNKMTATSPAPPAAPVITPPPPSSRPPLQPSPTASGLVEPTTEMGTFESLRVNYPVIFWFGVAFVAVFVICIFVFIVIYCCRKKEKVNDDTIVPLIDKNSKPSNDQLRQKEEGQTVEVKKKEESAEKPEEKPAEQPDEKKDDRPKDESLDVEKTQRSADQCMVLITEMRKSIESKTSEYAPTEYAHRILKGSNDIEKVMVDKEKEYCKMERRYNNVPVNKTTMANVGKHKGKTDEERFINNNVMPYKDKIIIMGQGPQKETPPDQIDTREKQYYVFDHYNVRVVSQLCQNVEYEVVNGEKIGYVKCDPYYPTTVNQPPERYGVFEVKCLKVDHNPPGFTVPGCILYKLSYKNLEANEKEKYIDIIVYTEWPDKSVPNNCKFPIEMKKFLDSYEANIFIHCSAGIGRTGALVGIMVGIEMCLERDVTSVAEIVQFVRNHRSSAIQTGHQLLYMIVCIGEGILNHHNVSYHKDQHFLKFCFEQMVSGKLEAYDEACRDMETKNKNKKKEEVQEAMAEGLRKFKEDYDDFKSKEDAVGKEEAEKLKKQEEKSKKKRDSDIEENKKLADNWTKQRAALYEEACKKGKAETKEKSKEDGKSKEKKKTEEPKPAESKALPKPPPPMTVATLPAPSFPKLPSEAKNTMRKETKAAAKK